MNKIDLKIAAHILKKDIATQYKKLDVALQGHIANIQRENEISSRRLTTITSVRPFRSRRITKTPKSGTRLA